MSKRRKAFTFIEIMIVIVIVGMLMAVSLPRLKGTFGRTQLTAAARDVTALMRFARDVAVLTEGRVELRFDPDNSAFQLVVFNRDGERIEPVVRRRRLRRNEESDVLTIGADLLQVQHLPKKVRFETIYAAADLTDDSNLPCVVFYPDGSATPTTVAMQDDDARTIRVEVYRTTGMTRVEEGLPPEAPKSQRLYYGPGA